MFDYGILLLMIKVCTKCKTGYAATAEYFSRDRTRKDGLRSNCKKCVRVYRQENRERRRDRNRLWRSKNRKKVRATSRRYRLKHKRELSEQNRRYRKRNPDRLRNKRFGLADGQYNEMLERQNHVCAICGLPEVIKDKRSDGARALSVDHNHKTNKIRGLLCNRCNSAIGNLCVDDHGVELLCSAISYVKNGDGV